MSTLVCPRCKTEPPIWQKLQPPSDDFDGDRYLCRCCGIIVTVSMTRRRMEMHGGVHMSEEKCPHGERYATRCLWCVRELYALYERDAEARRVRQVRENIEREIARPGGLPLRGPEAAARQAEYPRENTLDRERRRRGIVDSMLQMPPFLQTSWCLSPGTHAPDCQCAEVG